MNNYRHKLLSNYYYSFNLTYLRREGNSHMKKLHLIFLIVSPRQTIKNLWPFRYFKVVSKPIKKVRTISLLCNTQKNSERRNKYKAYFRHSSTSTSVQKSIDIHLTFRHCQLWLLSKYVKHKLKSSEKIQYRNHWSGINNNKLLILITC